MKTIKIKGMRCAHCTGSVRKALEAIEGIGKVEVDLEAGEARWEGEADLDDVRAAITAQGFEPVD